jgi:hypothetical protein
MPRRTIWSAIALGALVGALVLGVGGRIGMRIFAGLQGQAPFFKLSGSVAVVLIGAAVGASGGIVLWLGRKIFPNSSIARGLLFWGLLTFVTSRVLHPLTLHRVLVFGPIAALYGAVLYRLWCQRVVKRWRAAQTQMQLSA